MSYLKNTLMFPQTELKTDGLILIIIYLELFCDYEEIKKLINSNEDKINFLS